MKNVQVKAIISRLLFGKIGLALLLLIVCNTTTFAQEKDKVAIAQEVANPLTTMIFVPIQFNYDLNVGVNEDGSFSSLFIQPIIPFKIGDKWNLITRTIFSFYSKKDLYEGYGTQSGFGDITQSLFLSPSASKEGGITWGVGPVLSYPTATNDMGIGTFGMGPSIVALQIKGPWTYGILANHLWGFGDNVSSTFIQPILDYTSNNAVTYELTTEMTYDWMTENWSIPLIFTANKLVVIGKQMFMIGGGARYWADDTPYNPQNWGFNVSLYVLFPN